MFYFAFCFLYGTHDQLAGCPVWIFFSILFFFSYFLFSLFFYLCYFLISYSSDEYPLVGSVGTSLQGLCDAIFLFIPCSAFTWQSVHCIVLLFMNEEESDVKFVIFPLSKNIELIRYK